MGREYKEETKAEADGVLEPIKHLFWSYNISELDIDKNEKTIVLNVINYGNMEDWSRLVSIYGKERIRSVLETEGAELRPRVRRLAVLIFNVNDIKYETRRVDRRRAKNISSTD